MKVCHIDVTNIVIVLSTWVDKYVVQSNAQAIVFLKCADVCTNQIRQRMRISNVPLMSQIKLLSAEQYQIPIRVGISNTTALSDFNY
jgi:hypothetical protein